MISCSKERILRAVNSNDCGIYLDSDDDITVCLFRDSMISPVEKTLPEIWTHHFRWTITPKGSEWLTSIVTHRKSYNPIKRLIQEQKVTSA